MGSIFEFIWQVRCNAMRSALLTQRRRMLAGEISSKVSVIFEISLQP